MTLSTIDSIVDCKFAVSARLLASFTGQIIFTGPDVGSVSRIMTRHCSMSTLCAPSWDALLNLDQYTRHEIKFWKENKSRLCFLDKRPHGFGFSDASATGCGAVISLDSDHVCHKLCDSFESSKSSTWREPAAIDFSIESFGPMLEASHVKWFTDNQAAVKITETGSITLDLHRLAITILKPALRARLSWKYNGSLVLKTKKPTTLVVSLTLMTGN